MTRKIVTQHDTKPVPSKDYDWEAFREDWDLDEPIGYGKTEQEAVNDLLEREKAIQ